MRLRLLHHLVYPQEPVYLTRGVSLELAVEPLRLPEDQREALVVRSCTGAPALAQPVQLASLVVVTQSSSSMGLPQYVSLNCGLATCTLPIPFAWRMFISLLFAAYPPSLTRQSANVGPGAPRSRSKKTPVLSWLRRDLARVQFDDGHQDHETPVSP